MWLYMIKLIRWPNLIIVFITQWIVWTFLIKGALTQNGIDSNLSIDQFILLSVCTMLVAAAGYVINDIEDVKIDLINKPNKVIVGKYLTKQFCTTYYYTLLTVGLIIAVYLGWSWNKLSYVVLYPLFSGLLYYYAVALKKSFLLGNVLISLFVAFVPILIFLAEYEGVVQLNDQRLMNILILYGALAFLSNFIRELVKDIQDIKGDKAFGANTFPIRYGHRSGKILLSLILVILMSLILIWTFILDKENQSNLSMALGTSPLLLISLALLSTLPKLESPKQFGNWGNGIKIFMLFGLVFLYLQST